MQKIEIRRPRIDDKEKLHLFFQLVITDTFEKEGILDLQEDINKELRTKRQLLKDDFDSEGKNRYFLLAIDTATNEAIGSIEYGSSSELIQSCTKGKYKNFVEIGTVFVHPVYQRRGIGSLLLNAMLLSLQSRGITDYCLDSGYSSAQQIWKRKFGEPNYFLLNYWGEGSHHMIWKRSTNDTICSYEIRS